MKRLSILILLVASVILTGCGEGPSRSETKRLAIQSIHHRYTVRSAEFIQDHITTSQSGIKSYAARYKLDLESNRDLYREIGKIKDPISRKTFYIIELAVKQGSRIQIHVDIEMTQDKVGNWVPNESYNDTTSPRAYFNFYEVDAVEESAVKDSARHKELLDNVSRYGSPLESYINMY